MGGALIGAEIFFLAFLVGPGNLPRLVEMHAEARGVIFEGGDSGLQFGTHWPLLVLALWGGLISVVRKSWAGLSLLGWFGLGVAALMVSRPVWYHQQLLATVPAAMLAAMAIGDAFLYAWGRRRRAPANLWPKVGSVSVLVLAGLLAIGSVDRLQEFDLGWPNLRSDGQLESREYVVLATMAKYDPEHEMMVTDSPMYAFRSLREVPPQLAVFSEKRLKTGWLTEGQVIHAIEESHPKLVLLARFRLPDVEEYLEDGYRRAYTGPDARLFVRDTDD